ncbi:MAG: hypothetical protein ACK559_25700, partial [bacterium]
ELQVDRVAVEDHAEPPAGLGRGLGAGAGAGLDQRGLGGPPAHVAAALVEGAVEHIGGPQREVGEPRAAHAGHEAAPELLQLPGARRELMGERLRQGVDLLRDRPHLPG